MTAIETLTKKAVSDLSAKELKRVGKHKTLQLRLDKVVTRLNKIEDMEAKLTTKKLQLERKLQVLESE